MKREFESADKILKEFRNIANSPFYDPEKALRVQAESILLKTILEVRDLLIFIYQGISGKVDASGRPPS